jgi:hypothetical protein
VSTADTLWHQAITALPRPARCRDLALPSLLVVFEAAGGAGLSTAEVVNLTHKTAEAALWACRRLERAGLLRRRPGDPWQVTPAGRRYVAALRQFLVDIIEHEISIAMI